MNGFRQFLAELFGRKQAVQKCFIFSTHLISLSTLPGKIWNPEVESFHLNAAGCFDSKHEKHNQYHLVTIKLLLTVILTDCMHHVHCTAGEHSIVQYVISTHSKITESVTVLVAASKMGVIKPRVKINGQKCRDILVFELNKRYMLLNALLIIILSFSMTKSALVHLALSTI